KADQRRAWLQVVDFHDPHGATPCNVDRLIEESRYAITWSGRIDQFDVDTFFCIKSEGLGGVERRVEHGATVFSKPDWHDASRTQRSFRSPRPAAAGCLIHRNPAGLDGPSPFFDFGLDEFLQVLGRAALARDEVGSDLLHPHFHSGGSDGRESGSMKLPDNRRRRSFG